MSRRNFSKSVKLYDITANDELRPAMQCVCFKDGYAYATEAHMLIKAKIEDICNFDPEEIAILEGKMVSGASLKRICSHNEIQVTNDGFVATDNTGSGGGGKTIIAQPIMQLSENYGWQSYVKKLEKAKSDLEKPKLALENFKHMKSDMEKIEC